LVGGIGNDNTQWAAQKKACNGKKRRERKKLPMARTGLKKGGGVLHSVGARRRTPRTTGSHGWRVKVDKKRTQTKSTKEGVLSKNRGGGGRKGEKKEGCTLKQKVGRGTRGKVWVTKTEKGGLSFLGILEDDRLPRRQ